MRIRTGVWAKAIDLATGDPHNSRDEVPRILRLRFRYDLGRVPPELAQFHFIQSDLGKIPLAYISAVEEGKKRDKLDLDEALAALKNKFPDMTVIEGGPPSYTPTITFELHGGKEQVEESLAEFYMEHVRVEKGGLARYQGMVFGETTWRFDEDVEAPRHKLCAVSIPAWQRVRLWPSGFQPPRAYLEECENYWVPE